MNKTSSIADNETVVEYISSQTVLALKQKKKFRRRLIIVALTLPKILAVAYFGSAGVIDALEASAAALHPQTIAPFIR